jgi:carbon-monoxide dehydrogenase small subunit
MADTQISITVNGAFQTITVPSMKRLLDVLREDLHLSGTKEGCGEGECGACSVILDGQLVNSCLVPAKQADGARVETIEGLAHSSRLHSIQQAFAESGAAQCGICTPGMIMAAFALLAHNRQPSPFEIRQGLAGNICRCTGYRKIFDALEKASLRNA